MDKVDSLDSARNVVDARGPLNERLRIRAGFSGNTSGMAPGYGQGNLVVLPRDWADDFKRYCHANPTPCPLIGMTEPGSRRVPMLGDDIDICTDVPRYRIWKDGTFEREVTDISDLWCGDFVGFVIGCSLSFEFALQEAGLVVRHVEEGKIVPMYRTAIMTQPVRAFSGPMIVSMRPYTREEAQIAYEVCARLPGAHGVPVHIGDPARIGIADISSPDEGEATPIYPGEIPMFWGCGVTAQAALISARPPICITHAPGFMLVCDKKTRDLRLI
jgi:uncharacterized protein YcsI (UPF0317 family)